MYGPCLGTFVDVGEVPSVVVESVAGQLGLDTWWIESYGSRVETVLEDQWEIRRVFGFVDYADSEDELREFVAARA